MKVFALIVAFTVLTLLELPGLLKKRQWAEIAVYSMLLMIGFVLSLLLTVGIEVPNPDKAIQSVIRSSTRMLHLQ
ncbi:hypothetical protein O9H85_36505 [Paenibacillus filicis]|uniref:Uncharacterized protein n=1 Tax=Paenibacillus gyeongsangnamensis TaxID=3388067 RepID=A0ABT4QLM8_9BACL|nr:hypothetical protein [Paenibacillus filicis]MCZ8517717.1 hypothetical protein [Paenibacillus filicis]